MAAPLPTSLTRGPASEPLEPEERGDFPAAESSPEEVLESLMAELEERDELIEALTKQLGEAAEQLDRIHRMGGEKAFRQSAEPALTPEHLRRQLELSEQMEGMLKEWQELRPGALLERIDLRLDRLIDILRGGQAGASPTSEFSPSEFPSSGGDEIPSPPGEVHADRVSDSAAAGPSRDDGETACVDEEPVVEVDPPTPVDPELTDPEELHEAIAARDRYLLAVLAEFRRYRHRNAIDWEALADAPEETAERLRELEKRLTEDVRREELALSLERARLTREESRLAAVKNRLEKEIRRLGNAGGQIAPAQPPKPEKSGWGKLFGRKK